MRCIFRYLVRAIFVLALIAVAVGVWKREEIKRLLAVNSLFIPLLPQNPNFFMGYDAEIV
jgi:hypothetical protein